MWYTLLQTFTHVQTQQSHNQVFKVASLAAIVQSGHVWQRGRQCVCVFVCVCVCVCVCVREGRGQTEPAAALLPRTDKRQSLMMSEGPVGRSNPSSRLLQTRHTLHILVLQQPAVPLPRSSNHDRASVVPLLPPFSLFLLFFSSPPPC